MLNDRKEYIVIKTYADGRQLVMAYNDWSSKSRQSTRAVAGRLEHRSMLDVGRRIKWQIPTRKQWQTIAKMIADKKINFDDLHLRRNAYYRVADKKTFRNCFFDTRTRTLTTNSNRMLNYFSDKFLRPVAVIREEFLRPEFSDNLKIYVKRHGPLRWQNIVETTINIIEQLDQQHNAGLCHNDICPDNISVEETRSGLRLRLNKSKYETAMCFGGDNLMNWDEPRECFFAPENYLGDITPFSDMYQLAMTLYFAIHGDVPKGYMKPCRRRLHDVADAYTNRDPKPENFGDNYFEVCLRLALRLNYWERICSMKMWAECLKTETAPPTDIENFYDSIRATSIDIYTDTFYKRRPVDVEIFGMLRDDDSHCARHALEAYTQLGIRTGDFARSLTYWIGGEQFTYLPVERNKRMFRLATMPNCVYEIDKRGVGCDCEEVCFCKKCLLKYRELHVKEALNSINATQDRIRAFWTPKAVYLAYETLTGDETDFEQLIIEAHIALENATKLLKHLLDGGKADDCRQDKEGKRVEVASTTQNTRNMMLDVIQTVNATLANSRCVLRGDSVWIEASNSDANVVYDGNMFQFMRGYAFTLGYGNERPDKSPFDNPMIFKREEMSSYFTKFTEQPQTW